MQYCRLALTAQSEVCFLAITCVVQWECSQVGFCKFSINSDFVVKQKSNFHFRLKAVHFIESWKWFEGPQLWKHISIKHPLNERQTLVGYTYPKKWYLYQIIFSTLKTYCLVGASVKSGQQNEYFGFLPFPKNQNSQMGTHLDPPIQETYLWSNWIKRNVGLSSSACIVTYYYSFSKVLYPELENIFMYRNYRFF